MDPHRRIGVALELGIAADVIEVGVGVDDGLEFKVVFLEQYMIASTSPPGSITTASRVASSPMI
jgi:hypothetical protein